MPELLDHVLALRTLDVVDHENDARLAEQHTPAVLEPTIAAYAIEIILSRICAPCSDLDRGRLFPTERIDTGRLIASIDPHRVVRGRSAEPLAPFGIGYVRVAAGIAQN